MLLQLSINNSLKELQNGLFISIWILSLSKNVKHLDFVKSIKSLGITKSPVLIFFFKDPTVNIEIMFFILHDFNDWMLAR